MDVGCNAVQRLSCLVQETLVPGRKILVVRGGHGVRTTLGGCNITLQNTGHVGELLRIKEQSE